MLEATQVVVQRRDVERIGRELERPAVARLGLVETGGVLKDDAETVQRLDGLTELEGAQEQRLGLLVPGVDAAGIAQGRERVGARSPDVERVAERALRRGKLSDRPQDATEEEKGVHTSRALRQFRRAPGGPLCLGVHAFRQPPRPHPDQPPGLASRHRSALQRFVVIFRRARVGSPRREGRQHARHQRGSHQPHADPLCHPNHLRTT